ncbi:MFS transporter [Ruminococcaceae bacterium OttesenSCG-928-I18]|nr:MFS transporter [Ruminococcaceae bacterium OttesenSCG-928-I18]
MPFLSWGFVFLDRLTISYLAPLIVEEMTLSNTQVGLIGTVTTGMYALSSIIFGAVSDKTGSRKLWLIPFCIGTGIFSALGAATTDFTQLLLTRAAVGFCEGPILPMINTLMAKESTPSRVGLNLGIINTGVTVIAIILGPSFVALVASQWGWRMSFLLASIPTVVVALIMIFTVKRDTIIKSENLKDAPAQKDDQSIISKYVECLKNRNIMFCFLLGIFAMAGYWTLMLYNTLYWSELAGFSITTIGAVLSFTGVVGFVQALLIPKLSDWFGRKPVLFGSYALSFLAPLAMVTMMGTAIPVWAYLLFAGIPGCMTPLYMTVVPWESAPERIAGTAGGLILGVAEILGGSVWPFFAGLIADATNLTVTIGMAMVWFAAAAIMALCLKESNPKEKREAAKAAARAAKEAKS